MRKGTKSEVFELLHLDPSPRDHVALKAAITRLDPAYYSPLDVLDRTEPRLEST